MGQTYITQHDTISYLLYKNMQKGVTKKNLKNLQDFFADFPLLKLFCVFTFIFPITNQPTTSQHTNTDTPSMPKTPSPPPLPANKALK